MKSWRMRSKPHSFHTTGCTRPQRSGRSWGFPGLGVPGQGWATGRALSSQSLPMQVTGELVPGRQVLLGCAGGWEGLCPGDRRGMEFIQGPQFAVAGLAKPSMANGPGSSKLWRGKLRQGWLGNSRDSQLSLGHAQITPALQKVQPSASTPSASPLSPPPPLRQPGRAGQAAGTQYLHLHVPHVSKSLLLPLKMGLEGQGRDTGENKS